MINRVVDILLGNRSQSVAHRRKNTKYTFFFGEPGFSLSLSFRSLVLPACILDSGVTEGVTPYLLSTCCYALCYTYIHIYLLCLHRSVWPLCVCCIVRGACNDAGGYLLFAGSDLHQVRFRYLKSCADRGGAAPNCL